MLQQTQNLNLIIVFVKTRSLQDESWFKESWEKSGIQVTIVVTRFLWLVNVNSFHMEFTELQRHVTLIF